MSKCVICNKRLPEDSVGYTCSCCGDTICNTCWNKNTNVVKDEYGWGKLCQKCARVTKPKSKKIVIDNSYINNM